MCGCYCRCCCCCWLCCRCWWCGGGGNDYGNGQCCLFTLSSARIVQNAHIIHIISKIHANILNKLECSTFIISFSFFFAWSLYFPSHFYSKPIPCLQLKADVLLLLLLLSLLTCMRKKYIDCRKKSHNRISEYNNTAATAAVAEIKKKHTHTYLEIQYVVLGTHHTCTRKYSSKQTLAIWLLWYSCTSKQLKQSHV